MKTNRDKNPIWLCTLVTALPILLGLALAFGFREAPQPVETPAADREVISTPIDANVFA
jgi:hypothetical protein